MTEVESVEQTWLSLELPYGASANYPLPYSFVRSAIFTSLQYTGRHERPRYTKQTRLAAYGSVAIYQLSGEQLDGNDLDVLGALINLASNVPRPPTEAISVAIATTEVALLKALGWLTDGSARERLKASLIRMKVATYLFESIGLDSGLHATNFVYSLTRAAKNGSTAKYTIHLNKQLAPLINEGWSLVNKAQRQALHGDTLAQSLHAFYSSHRDPRPISEATLRPILQREGMRNDKWISALKSSLVRLGAETGWKCGYAAESRWVTVKKQKAKELAVYVAPLAPKVLGSKPSLKLTEALGCFVRYRDDHSFLTKSSTEELTKRVNAFCAKYGESISIKALGAAQASDDFEFKFAPREFEAKLNQQG